MCGTVIAAFLIGVLYKSGAFQYMRRMLDLDVQTGKAWEDNRKRINQMTQRQWMKDLRERSPRVHCITNYVTAGDVANMVLAAGGSPVMAQGLHEVEDVTSICSSLVLNLGTLEERTYRPWSSGKKSGRPGPSRYPGPGRSHCITVSQTDSH